MPQTFLKVFFVIALCTCSFQIQAQEFAPLGAKWTYAELEGDFHNWCNFEGIYAITVDSQTIIANKTVNVISHSNSTEQLFILNDSNRVYFYEDSTFHLVMDFNLQSGDTFVTEYPSNINTFVPNCAGFYFQDTKTISVVRAVSSIIVGTNTLKQLECDYIGIIEEDSIVNYHSQQPFTITEKIGSLIWDFLPFPYHAFLLWDCCNNSFLCYEDNDILYDPDNSNCTYTGIENTETIDLNIYPTITNDWITVESRFTQPLVATLFSVNGDLILTRRIFPNDRMDLRNLSSGLYLLQLEVNGQRAVKRVVKN